MKTEIISILDRSGSMQKIAPEVIGGYNNFLKEQREVPGEARVTLIQFDDLYDVIYQGCDLKEAPDLNKETFVPRGWTALLDAIGKTLNTQRKRIHDEKWADKVIVCIVTDGDENASKEYTTAQIKGLVTAAQEWGNWTFIFQGANIDTFAAAKQYGINPQFTSNFVANAAGAAGAYQTFSSTTRSIRSAPVPSPSTEWNVPSSISLSDKA